MYLFVQSAVIVARRTSPRTAERNPEGAKMAAKNEVPSEVEAALSHLRCAERLVQLLDASP